LLITGLFLALFAGAVYSAETPSKGYISVNIEATDDFMPTSVKISFAIETRSSDAKTAADENKTLSNKVIALVKETLDSSKNESVKTTSYNVSPEYNYKEGKKLIGYLVSNTLEAELKDVEKTGKVISAALAGGANSVRRVQFNLDDTNDNCNILIQKAAKEARLRADKVANSMNTSVTGIKSISTSCSSSQNASVRMYSAKNTDSISEGAEVPIEAGKTRLRAYVNADFYVK
ncbi:MAG: SIMPL domain-containing protein, partial [Candidatus Gastranaerophilales bacterium]|nr:SIMPL domain-containing protein [Candidatus Gastranaerophilales bacterium]